MSCHARKPQWNTVSISFNSVSETKSQCVIAASETTVVNFIVLVKGWYRLRTGGIKATTIFVVFGFYTSTKNSSSINKWSLLLIFVIILYKSINCAARYKRGFYNANIFIFNMGCNWLYCPNCTSVVAELQWYWLQLTVNTSSCSRGYFDFC